MRPQKVSVDIFKMIFSSCSYLAVVFAAWIFVKLLYACFWLPAHLKKQSTEEEAKSLLKIGMPDEDSSDVECEENTDKKND